MSQVSTVMVDQVVEKSGEKNGKPWTRWGLKDGNGYWYSTFERGVVLESMKGQRVEIEWEQNGDYRNLLRASPAEPKPEPGTANYIKGKEAPETQRAIRASVALNAAVAYYAATPEAQQTLTEHGVVLIAKVFYRGLEEMAEGKDQGGQMISPSSDEMPI